MATWYSIELNDDEAAKKTMQRVMDAFVPKYVSAGRPVDMAIFTSQNEDNKIITLYFSAKAVSLAMQFGAAPCDDTFVNTDLSLLVGDQRSIELLFPDAQPK